MYLFLLESVSTVFVFVVIISFHLRCATYWHRVVRSIALWSFFSCKSSCTVTFVYFWFCRLFSLFSWAVELKACSFCWFLPRNSFRLHQFFFIFILYAIELHFNPCLFLAPACFRFSVSFFPRLRVEDKITDLRTVSFPNAGAHHCEPPSTHGFAVLMVFCQLCLRFQSSPRMSQFFFQLRLWSFRRVLINFHIFVAFLKIFLLLIFNFFTSRWL